MSGVAAGAEAEVVEPRDLAGARAAVAGDGALLFRGAGTKLDWGAAPARVDRVVATTRLDRLLAHDPGDLTATVQAGMPLARLQERLAEHGQWLALDPPSERHGATVGGLLASGDAGPRRLRYGTLRDLVIGTTAVLSDGAVSRSGGNVIKNVAGYDLSRLLCGSLGTLALVVEVTVRLHPRPPASATVRVPAAPAMATALALAVLAAPLEPAALDWHGDPAGDGWLLARFDGRPDGIDAQTGALRRLADACGAGGAERLDDGAAAQAWDDVGTALAGRDGETVVRAATLPGQLGDAAAALAAAALAAAALAAATGSGVHARLHSHAGLGVHTARLSGAGPVEHARTVEAWRAALLPGGGHAVVRRRVAGFADHADVWGPPPHGLALMRSVKEQFDPARRCAPGRFVGGL